LRIHWFAFRRRSSPDNYHRIKQYVRQVKIIGTGSYTPEKLYTNKYLETIIDTNDAWIQKNLGIKDRRIAAPDEATSDLGVIAAKNAIENAGLSEKDIDLIIQL